MLLVWLSHLTFFYDEWDPLLLRRGLNAHVLLDPHVDHILLGPTVFYKALQATVGMESLVPYAIVSTASFLVSVLLLFIYLRRRVGEWLALAGALPILFLGAAHQDLLWPFEISFHCRDGGGIGALLALERPEGRGDLIACCLLILALSFSELALSFVLGAALVIAIDRGPRRRAYVVPYPSFSTRRGTRAGGTRASTHITFHGIANSFSYLLDGLAASVASILGFANQPSGGLGLGTAAASRPGLCGLRPGRSRAAPLRPLLGGPRGSAVVLVSPGGQCRDRPGSHCLEVSVRRRGPAPPGRRGARQRCAAEPAGHRDRPRNRGLRHALATSRSSTSTTATLPT